MIPPQENPQAGPSGGIPEGGIVITGDERFMCAAASEYFPVGHDVDVEDNDTGDTDPVWA